MKTIILLLLLFIPNQTILAKRPDLKQNLIYQLKNYQQHTIKLPTALKLYQNSAIFIDTRSAQSYEKNHIPNSLNIPITDLAQTILEKPGILPKDKPIYLICCAKDRNVMYALLPLRLAGYDAHVIIGGGIDAWEYLKLPTTQGKSEKLQERHQTKLNKEETNALATINPTLHMIKAGRSYVISQESLEKIITDKQKPLIIEISDNKKTLPYAEHTIQLAQLPTAKWLKNANKEILICLVGTDDKQLVLGMMTLRTLGYKAIIAVKE